MQNEHTQHSGEIDVPVEAIQIIDPAVVANPFIDFVPGQSYNKLPKGTVVNAITAHGASFWTRTARLDTKLNGEAEEYLLKTCHGDRGRGMVSGEFASMSTMYAAMPNLVPRPLSWGTYDTIPGVHFFLCAFHEMDGRRTARRARLPRRPDSRTAPKAPRLPMRKFGFPSDDLTMSAYRSSTAGWSDAWEELFHAHDRGLLLDMEQERLRVRMRRDEEPRCAFPGKRKVVSRTFEAGGDGWSESSTLSGSWGSVAR